ncbi:hypothetical protein OG205_13150 [Lentzea sp. NBC_00516]|uniref:hypothetical protein n=1 Tax=Lentzea sp. NBC_00516 TaxID=2903582 RepID=UPI002E7FDC3B|nr:hypothetical protein [Lentzea sp. NBC_00516]WUD27899.1 hypothetical protein OG205_13150 [Lentzea sp. NBC_00516]
MRRFIVAALCLFAAACGTSAPATTSTPSATPVEDAQSIRDVFDTYAKAALANDGATAVEVVSRNTLDEYDKIRKLALTATESELDPLVPSGRVLAYAMRADLDPSTVRGASPKDLVKAAVDRNIVGAASIADVTLDKPAITKDNAIAKVLLDGEFTGTIFGFVREDGRWKFDSLAVFGLTDADLNALRNEKNLSKDQLFDEVLVAKYGAAKAAEVRLPLGG